MYINIMNRIYNNNLRIIKLRDLEYSNRNWNGGRRNVVSKRMESKSRACTSRMVVNPLLGLTLGNVLERFVSKRRIPTGACVSALIPHSKLANRFPFCAWPAIDRRIVGALFKFQRRSTVLYLWDLLSCVLYPRRVKFLLKGARFTKWW